MKKLLLVLPLGVLLLLPTSASAVFLNINANGEIEVYDDRVLGEETDQQREIVQTTETPTESPKPELLRRITPQRLNSQEIRLRPTTKEETVIQVREQQKEGEFIRTPADREKAKLKEEFNADRVRLEFNDNKSELREVQRQKASEFREAELEALELAPEERLEFLMKRTKEAEVELEEARYRVENREDFQKMKIEDTVVGEERQIRLESPDGSASRLINGELILEADSNTIRVATPDGTGEQLRTFPSEVVESLQTDFEVPETSKTDIELEIMEEGGLRHRVRDVTREERVFGIFPISVRGDALVDDATGEVEFESNEVNPVKRFLRIFRR